ncbi:hypothetical protein F66182_7516 [Fusarium sp. NRRL 66182]|nr:hypothetical protein F66182_7516 [Fusarium sp. NRRL 66182]
MAPTRPNNPSTPSRASHPVAPQGTTGGGAPRQEDVSMETDEDEPETITPASHEDKVRKLRRKLKELGQ